MKSSLRINLNLNLNLTLALIWTFFSPGLFAGCDPKVGPIRVDLREPGYVLFGTKASNQGELGICYANAGTMHYKALLEKEQLKKKEQERKTIPLFSPLAAAVDYNRSFLKKEVEKKLPIDEEKMSELIRGGIYCEVMKTMIEHGGCSLEDLEHLLGSKRFTYPKSERALSTLLGLYEKFNERHIERETAFSKMSDEEISRRRQVLREEIEKTSSEETKKYQDLSDELEEQVVGIDAKLYKLRVSRKSANNQQEKDEREGEIKQLHEKYQELSQKLDQYKKQLQNSRIADGTQILEEENSMLSSEEFAREDERKHKEKKGPSSRSSYSLNHSKDFMRKLRDFHGWESFKEADLRNNIYAKSCTAKANGIEEEKIKGFWENVKAAIKEISPATYVLNVIDEACQEKVKLEDNQLSCESETDPAKFAAYIEEELCKGQEALPVAVAYNAAILQDTHEEPGEQIQGQKNINRYSNNHVSLIVGQLEKEGKVYYILRNSWDEDCSRYTSRWTCDENGDLLIEREILLKNYVNTLYQINPKNSKESSEQRN